MPTTKSQSPGPNSATSQPKQARSRKAPAPAEQIAAGRAGSAGGIVLDVKSKTSSDPSVATKGTASPATKATTTTTPAAASSSTPNRPKRKPRKLNKEPAPEQSTTAATPIAATALPAESELEALKSRVRGLEAKVEELYTSTEARTGHSPRRRGKGRKGSSAAQVPTLSTPGPSRIEDEEPADEELVRLEDELETARRDLDIYQPPNRPRTKRSTSEESVEEIPRDGSEPVAVGDRQVTLSGSYRIPLPATLDMKDVQKIQSGVSAAQNVAKSFLDQRRAVQAAKTPTPPTASSSTARPKAAARKASAPSSMEISKETNGKSWGEWFGGYSVAISRAVKNIEAEAAVENQKSAKTAARPAPVKRSNSAASTVKKTAPAAGPKKRPSMKGRQGNSSNDI